MFVYFDKVITHLSAENNFRDPDIGVNVAGHSVADKLDRKSSKVHTKPVSTDNFVN